MFNVGNHSIRGTIRAKYLLADNVRYKRSRNVLILEFRNFRNKMAALEDVLYNLSLNCEVEYRKLDPSQSLCINEMSKVFALSAKENRMESYVNGINLLANFINGQAIKDDIPFSKNELKAARMLTGHLFMMASQYIAELNMK